MPPSLALTNPTCSAHRTPTLTAEFASEADRRGIEVIAGAGGAAQSGASSLLIRPCRCSACRFRVALNGLDSLLSIVQMRAFRSERWASATGAANAALLAVAILAVTTGASRKAVTFAEQA
jgi:5-(carboxyamino)imidazole ribonucleotide mutase